MEFAGYMGLHLFRPTTKKEDGRFDDRQGTLVYNGATEVLVELAQQGVLLVRSKLSCGVLVGNQKALGTIAEPRIKAVEIFDLSEGGQIFLQVLFISSDDRQCVTNLVDKIAEDYDPEELDDDNYDDLYFILRSDITVANRQDSCRAEI